MKVFPDGVDERRQERVVVIEHDSDDIRRGFGIAIQAGVFAGGTVCIVVGVEAAGSRQAGYAIITA